MCLYGQLIKNPKYLPNKKNGGIIPHCHDKRVMAVPIACGRCMECMNARGSEWQTRLLEDVRHNKNGKFITLTFSNESIKEIAEKITTKTTKVRTGIKSSWKDKNGKLCHRYKYRYSTEKIILKGYETDNAIATYAVEKFRERWRKAEGKSPRHFLITELGHQGTENIHLHGIIWTDDVEKVTKHWGYGFTWTGETDYRGIKKNYVTEQTVNYITKYITKVDFDHKYFKSKILTSAGIGKGYLDRQDWIKNKYNPNGETREYYKNREGYKLKLPIYWRNKIYSEWEREQLWLEKLNKNIRYVDKEEIDISNGEENYWKAIETARIKNARLGFETRTIDWNRKRYEEDRRKLLQQERIGTKEDAAMAVARRGASPTGEAFALDDIGMIWKWDEKELYYDERTVYDEEGVPDWVNEEGIIVSW